MTSEVLNLGCKTRPDMTSPMARSALKSRSLYRGRRNERERERKLKRKERVNDAIEQ